MIFAQTTGGLCVTIPKNKIKSQLKKIVPKIMNFGVPPDICFLTLILYMIFPHLLCCKVCPRRYPKGLISLLATSDRSSEVIIVLGHGQILLRHSLLLFRVQLPFLPSLVVLGYSLIFGLGIGPGPFLCSLYI